VHLELERTHLIATNLIFLTFFSTHLVSLPGVWLLVKDPQPPGGAA